MATLLEDLQAELVSATAARDRIYAAGQEGSTVNRRRRDADLQVILNRIDALRAQIADLQNTTQGGNRLHRGVPL